MESSTWRDKVIDFMRQHNNDFFTAAWLSDRFGVDEDVLDQFIDIEIEKGTISYLPATINQVDYFLLIHNNS